MCSVLAGCDATPPVLVTSDTAIAPGVECALGGIRRSSGLDNNGNGLLDPGEVDDTKVLCRPQPVPDGPPPTLLRTDVEPPGRNCFHGGTAVQSGADLNGDGVLEDIEILMTTYACTVSDLFDGDFTAVMWSDPAAVLALGQARVVTGSLAIDRDAAVSLPNLVLVGGSITISRAGTPGFEADALAQVGGDLVVEGAGLSGELVLPALVRVGGALTVSGASLTGFRAPVLTHVDGDLTVRGPVAAIELPALRSAGAIVFTDLAVSSLELPALTTVLGELSIARLHALALLDLSALRSIGSSMELADLPVLGAIDLPLLGDARHLFLTSVGARTLRLPTLSVVEGHLWIVDSLGLEGLTLPALVTIGGSLVVARCPRFSSLDAPVLDGVGELEDDNDFALRFDAVDLRALILPRLRSAPSGVRVTESSIGALRLPALTRASRLQLQGNVQLTALELPALRSVESAVLDAPALRDLRLDALATVSQRLEIRNTQLVDLRGLASLRAIGDRPRALANLVIDGNPQLASLAGLEQLAAITGKLTLTNDAKLASLAGLAGLVTVGGAVTVTGDPALSPDELAALIARVHP